MTIQRHINCDFCGDETKLPDNGLEGWGRIEGMAVVDSESSTKLFNPTACPKCFLAIQQFCIDFKQKVETGVQ